MSDLVYAVTAEDGRFIVGFHYPSTPDGPGPGADQVAVSSGCYAMLSERATGQMIVGWYAREAARFIAISIGGDIHVMNREKDGPFIFIGQGDGKKGRKDMANKKQNKADNERMEIDRYEEMLPCKIPDGDIAEKAEALALVIEERAQTKERRRAVMGQFREKLTHYDERIKELGESVRLKTERHPVVCVEYLIERQNKVEIVRSDTDEIIKTRAATPEDRQSEMFEGESKKKPPRKRDTEPADAPANE